MKKYKDMTNEELLITYYWFRDVVDGILPVSWGNWELQQLEELEHEMTKREES